MKIGQHKTHPAADVFPLIDGEERAELVVDIKAHGLRHPVVTHGGLVLDGRNRLLACIAANVKPRFVEFKGKDPAAFVVSANLKRRHLNESQRAMVAARIATLGHGGDRSTGKSAACSQGKASKLLTVGERTVRQARAVIAVAASEVVAEIDAGRLSLAAAEILAKQPAQTQREIVAEVRKRGKGEIRGGLVRALARQATKRETARQIAEEPPGVLGGGPYRVIVSDPPWDYEKRAGDATHRGDLPYPSMSTQAICDMQIPEAHDDCVLWLWTTNAFMRDAFRVLDSWGFREKTILTWVKDRMGLGDWLRGKTEHCILAVRGNPTVLLDNQTTVLNGPVREHSRKPDEFYALVEAMCPGAKAEMFSRTPRKGWDTWGAETGRFSP